MKKLLLILACTCTSVFAESRTLPPVVDSVSNSQTSTGNNALHGMLEHLEQLQAEMQQLRGAVEEQSHAIARLKSRQGNIYSDLDSRIQALTDSVNLKGSAAASKKIVE